MIKIGRRPLFLRSLATLFVDHVVPAQDATDIDHLGHFEVVPGRPGVVVGVPHATADAGTSGIGRVRCRRVGASGIFVSGSWDGRTRQRINVNRPTEQLADSVPAY